MVRVTVHHGIDMRRFEVIGTRGDYLLFFGRIHPDKGTVEAIDVTDIKQVTLIPASAKRLGIQTAPVGREVVGGRSRTVMPYAALLYDELYLRPGSPVAVGPPETGVEEPGPGLVARDT